MDHRFIVNSILQNKETFRYLLQKISKPEFEWRSSPEKWCLLEIVCHLYDEEQFDFRARAKHVIENPGKYPPSIDPAGWVRSKKYMEQNYEEILNKFLNERDKSVEWLKLLNESDLKKEYIHPEHGPLSAEFFIANWLAHDYLHFRQITRVRYEYLGKISGINLVYAGKW